MRLPSHLLLLALASGLAAIVITGKKPGSETREEATPTQGAKTVVEAETEAEGWFV